MQGQGLRKIGQQRAAKTCTMGRGGMGARRGWGGQQRQGTQSRSGKGARREWAAAPGLEGASARWGAAGARCASCAHRRLRRRGLSSGSRTGFQAGPSAVWFSGLARALSSSACGEEARGDTATLEPRHSATFACRRHPAAPGGVGSAPPGNSREQRRRRRAHPVHVAVLAPQRAVQLVVVGSQGGGDGTAGRQRAHQGASPAPPAATPPGGLWGGGRVAGGTGVSGSSQACVRLRRPDAAGSGRSSSCPQPFDSPLAGTHAPLQ